jgi:hypothetical protein
VNHDRAALAQQPRRLLIARLKYLNLAKFCRSLNIIFTLKKQDAEGKMCFNRV